jgi:hypothetical protein
MWNGPRRVPPIVSMRPSAWRARDLLRNLAPRAVHALSITFLLPLLPVCYGFAPGMGGPYACWSPMTSPRVFLMVAAVILAGASAALLPRLLSSKAAIIQVVLMLVAFVVCAEPLGYSADDPVCASWSLCHARSNVEPRALQAFVLSFGASLLGLGWITRARSAP